MVSSPILQLRNVGKHYDTNTSPNSRALENVSIDILSSDFIAVVGKSGSGKTTLLNLLSGLDQPTSGEVRFGAENLSKLSESRLARLRGRSIGVVFQFYQLLPTLTILENVLLPMDFLGAIPPARRVTRARELLDLTGVADQAGKLPGTLSGGQLQRAAIARSLANDPKILLADEPTGNLDSSTAESVLGLFESLHSAGTTLLIVTHDDELARRANRIVRISDGRITSDERKEDRL